MNLCLLECTYLSCLAAPGVGHRKVLAVFKTNHQDGWDLMRQFWLSAIWIRNMPRVLVSDLLSESHYRRFLGVAKKGSSNWTRGCG